jgi:hypothetical protein
MTLQRYLQPVAIHRMHAERLLLTDDEARWFLWMGEADADPIEIPARLAMYLMDRSVMHQLGATQRMWFMVSDLPVREPLSEPIRADSAEWEFMV